MTTREEVLNPKSATPAPHNMIGTISPMIERTIRKSVASLVGFGLFTIVVRLEFRVG